MITYPRRNERNETVWACCESAIGPTCQHKRESMPEVTAQDVRDVLDEAARTD